MDPFGVQRAQNLRLETRKSSLNKLGEDFTICINWIKAHVDHKGNEIADALAKTGCKLPTREEIPLSIAHIKTVIKDEMYKTWDRRWQTQGD